METTKNQHSSSFRDPSGYVFVESGLFKRVINPIYFEQYSALVNSGFFNKLFQNKLLIEHEELSKDESRIVIQPEQIPFITYPYEWSFNQYKEAALLTLKIQKYAVEHNFSLKDASAFNIVFHNGKAIFIDTLSFDFYKENEPWRAYKQFIEHFLAPLLLSHYHGAQSIKLMSNFIDGIPIKMLSSMLPFKTKLNPFLYSNAHLLAKFENRYKEDYSGRQKTLKLSKKGQLDIIKSLYSFIKKLSLKENTEWGNYYTKTNYSDDAFNLKSEIIDVWIDKLSVKTLIDIGGNDGTFVRRIKHKFEQALVCDIDNKSIDHCHAKIRTNKEVNILPFVLDVLSPSAPIGFNNLERQSFLDRIQSFAPDVTLALALIHHMSLSGNITFSMSAKFFASFSKYLIIEFPKRSDSWVECLLNAKGPFKNHFDFYNINEFEEAYSKHFDLIEKTPIGHSERIMYLFKAIKC